MTSPVRIIVGDCLEAMRGMDAESVDAIVTDPPYGLSFMGKHWDHGVPGVDFWIEALRVAKPGTHLLAFGGTRTYHRLACAIEDAGWEVRDCIAWVYGSGFPKSLDVSKAIDKAAGVEFDAVPASGVGFMNAEGAGGYNVTKNQLVRKGESTDLARQWSGWGTALKPAFEPIIVARKPLIGTVAENVTTHGTGAINVDGCRVDCSGESLRGGGVGTRSDGWDRPWKSDPSAIAAHKEKCNANADRASSLGRWPANLIHDGSAEVVGLFPQTAKSPPVGSTCGSFRGASQFANGAGGGFKDVERPNGYGDSGSAARFFYCAKASRRDRDEGLDHLPARARPTMGNGIGGHPDQQRENNHHPTVKPTSLMRYLCRLVTPPGGIVLDPFAGSGSTGKGAVLEGFNFIGIELDAEYAEIARARIGNATPADKGLFA